MAGFTPTLLLGVGGTGSRIVQNVYDKARRAGVLDEGRLKVLAMDTDDADTRRLGLLDSNQIVRFSNALTIDELLDHYPEVEERWFVPRDMLPAEIRTMTPMHGAGQVRMISRLALYDTAATGEVERVIGAALSELQKFDGTTTTSGFVNVLIVGSLAGATGAGSYLQIALIIRELARRRNLTLFQRGLFLMPDIYVRSGVLPQGQVPSVLANGYASFKEFHALTLKATDRSNEFEFEFEFMPGQFMETGLMPYASLTVIDYENTEGGNLGRSVIPYTKLAERAVYTLLFTPIGGRADSTIVNELRTQMAAAAKGTHNRISSIGISSIVYPHEDVVRYLSLNMAREILSGDWLRLDRMYKERVRRYQHQRAAGNTSAKEPEVDISYLEDLRQLAVSDNVAFFKEIFNELYPKSYDDDGNEEEEPLHEAYLANFWEYVQREFWGRPKLAEIRNADLMDIRQLAARENIVDTVRKHEMFLDTDLQELDSALISMPDDIVIGMFSSADSMGEAEWQPHHLQYYLARGGPHLVRSRAFLYALRLEVEKVLEELDVEGKKEELFRLADDFRDDDELDRGDAPPERRGTPNVLKKAHIAAESGFFKRMLGKGEKDFPENYVEYYNNSRQKMVEYATTLLQRKAYARLLQEINEQIRVLSGLFDEIGDLLNELEISVQQEERRHEGESGQQDNVIHVFADSTCKRVLWEEVQNRMAGQKLGEDVNRSLMMAVYAMARQARIENRPQPLSKLRKLFTQKVVDGFAHERILEDYAGVHDMSVVQAIRRQAEVAKEDERDLIIELLSVAEQRSAPMVTVTHARNGELIRFWALHPELLAEMDHIDSHDTLLSAAGQGVDVLDEAEFPKNEILAVSLLVNLEVTHLAKLTPPDEDSKSLAPERGGRYFEEYQRMVDELILAAAEKRLPSTITPHIHRDWHKPGVLPEISKEMTQRYLLDVARAYYLALATDLMKVEPYYGEEIVRLYTVGRVRNNGVEVTLGTSKAFQYDYFLEYKAFREHPEAMRGVLRFWDEIRNGAPDNAELQRAEKGLTDPAKLQHIYRMLEQDPDELPRQRNLVHVFSALPMLLDELKAVIQRNIPDDVRLQEVEHLTEEIGKNALKGMKKAGDEAVHVMEMTFAKGLEQWREMTGLA